MAAKELTRGQLIRRGKIIRAAAQAFYKLKFRLSGRATGEERFLVTDVGRVRTLCYGFEDASVKPVVFDMHGGGFILMSADVDERFCTAFVNGVGCKVISVDYAKAPEYPFPAAVNEVYAVVKHVGEHADEYVVDPNKMAIGGHSAGVNLAAATALSSAKAMEFAFRFQVLDYPPLDLATSPYDKPNPKGGVSPRMATVFDRCYIADPADARNPYVSPVYASADDLRCLPPALVIAPGKDSLHDEAVKYAAMLRDAGVETELHEFPEEAHGFTYRPRPASEEALRLMVDFLKKHLH